MLSAVPSHLSVLLPVCISLCEPRRESGLLGALPGAAAAAAAIARTQQGTARHTASRLRRVCGGYGTLSDSAPSAAAAAAAGSQQQHDHDVEDADVVEERRRVRAGEWGPEDSVVIDDMHKVRPCSLFCRWVN